MGSTPLLNPDVSVFLPHPHFPARLDGPDLPSILPDSQPLAWTLSAREAQPQGCREQTALSPFWRRAEEDGRPTGLLLR